MDTGVRAERDARYRNSEKGRATKRAYAQRYSERRRQIDREKNYDLAPWDYDAMREAQGGLCAICRTRPGIRVDHDHSDGRVRGLLCDRCNLAIGALGDTAAGVRAALAYLEGYEAKRPVAAVLEPLEA